jgi:uncharacterized protein YbjT (DUF2867 family)
MRIAVAGGTGVAGRYAVAAARAQGHDVVPLSRAGGVDVVTGAGLDEALEGVEVVIDALNGPSTGRAQATAFFTTATANLQTVGARRGVRRLVVLSIVGIDRVPGFAYYDAKRAHEDSALAGPVPADIVRATQFHEFAGQLLDRLSVGPVAPVPSMRVQPVAARTVGEQLVAVAASPEPTGRTALAGPEAADLVAMARRTADVRGLRRWVVPVRLPGAVGAALRGGALLPDAGDGARLAGPGPDDWLSSADAHGGATGR